VGCFFWSDTGKKAAILPSDSGSEQVFLVLLKGLFAVGRRVFKLPLIQPAS
jgi:hypothetical protein